MSATIRMHKSLAVCAIAIIAAAALFAAPQPAFAGKKTKNVILGIAAGAAGLALLSAISKNKNKSAQPQPPVRVAQPPRRRPVYRQQRPTRGYYPRRPRRPVYAPAPRPRAQYSPQTLRIQQSLAAIGYNAGIADGLMGRSTRSAVSQFQSSLGQNPTGYMTPAQQNILFQRAAGGAVAPRPVAYPAAPGYRPPMAAPYPVTPVYRPPGAPVYRQPAAPVYRQPAAPVYRPPAAPVYRQPAAPVYRPPAAPVYRQPVVRAYPVAPSRGRGVPVAGIDPSLETTAAMRIPATAPPARP